MIEAGLFQDELLTGFGIQYGLKMPLAALGPYQVFKLGEGKFVSGEFKDGYFQNDQGFF
jgi:hypothetical protein